MRVWLDQHRCEPSRFLYDLENGEAVIRLDFKITREADAFAARFDGRIVSALDHQGA
ncbi:MAG TPA: hypothetical protein VFA50_17130 [Stellaceae bacterium]|nr:hypothetical protein [Stellaceae bacterium]